MVFPQSQVVTPAARRASEEFELPKAVLPNSMWSTNAPLSAVIMTRNSMRHTVQPMTSDREGTIDCFFFRAMRGGGDSAVYTIIVTLDLRLSHSMRESPRVYCSPYEDLFRLALGFH